MKLDTSIGVIGNGFVGAAVRFGFGSQTGCDATVRGYDKDESKSLNTLDETINKSDIIFLSVPTPSNLDGSIHIGILESVLSDIDSVHNGRDNVILIRSTVTPGTTKGLQAKFPNLSLVFNPEFLTERSAKFDFINQARVILGGHMDATEKVANLYRARFGEALSIIETNTQTAEMIKYMNNCFFATKVSFMNEMYDIAGKCGVEWDTAIDGFVGDGRIGHSHLAVPGPDGRRGFGGSCFPKDVQALLQFGDELGVELNTLKGAWNTNLNVRPEKDWEQLKGRAIIDE